MTHRCEKPWASEIDAAHDAAIFEDFIWKAAKLQDVELPGMLPSGWEMGPFGPVQTLSAADAIKSLAYLHHDLNITTIQPRFHAKIQDLPEPTAPRSWWRRLRAFLLGIR